MNETLKTIAGRYSCRAFTAEMPEDEQLRAVANAALAAPSGMNRQPWRVIVVKNRALIADMEAEGIRALQKAEDQSAYRRIQSRGGRMFYGAPCMAVVAIDRSSDHAVMDCGILAQNITLAAASLGLGSVICAMAALSFSTDRRETFKQRLGIPDGYEFGVAVLLGYPAGPGAPHQPDGAKVSFIE